MSMALVMSQMPDVWRKVLAEHVPDASRYCRECRNDGGRASWPCQTYRIAQEAKWVAEGNLPGTGPHGPGPSASPYVSPPAAPRRPDPLGPDPLSSEWRPSDGSFRGQPAPSWGSPDPGRYGTGGHPSTGALPATGAWPAPTSGSYPLPAAPPGPSTGSYPSAAVFSGGRPLAGDPLGTPYPEPAMSASHAGGDRSSRPGGDQPYGSTFDAPYGASFGVDDRPHARY